MKKIICLISILLAVSFLLASCAGGAKKYDDNDDSTTDATTAEKVEEERPVYPIMDLLNNKNLSQYVTLGDYMNLKVTLNVAVSDETVDKELEDYAKEYNYYTLITDRATAKGDVLDINFAGTIDGVAFEGGTAENQNITLSESTGYIDGFDKDLYGIMPGTTVETTVKFPDDYGVESLNGKEAVFTIKVNGICKYEFTDESIAKLTTDEYKTVDAFREYIRNSMIIENLNYYESDLKSKVIEALEDVSEIILLPEAQVNYYYYDMMNYYEDYYEGSAAMLQIYYGIADFAGFLEYLGITEESTMDSAKIYVIEDLLLISLANDFKLTLTDEDYTAGVAQYAKDWGYDSTEELIKDYGEIYLRQALVKDKCIGELLKLVEVTTDYDEYKHLLDEETETEDATVSLPEDVTSSTPEDTTTAANNG